ncbi:MAG: serine/threonine protein kinase [Deltaproteobacteria bacterium]|nr:serine/threonine protein kinase [Deltaproteobacteria bacterium]
MTAALNDAPPATPEEALPRRFGKYTLLRRMATGGMAEIFLALQRSVAGFEKLIVIKRILPAMNQDRGFIDMLLHEARIAASLSHPNIVQTIDVGQVDGTYFIALEHIHGEDLRSIVRQMKKKGVTEFPLEHAIAIILGMCAGLSYAHEKRDLDGAPLGIVHRDISPQNVLVGFAGDTKIVDFGVAKSDNQGGSEQTKSGQLKGKVPYMSPEQARGEEVDWRSDIFATGVMLFELTTGKRLFKGSTEFETLKLICDRDYPRPSWVANAYPLGLETIVMRALEKDREKRYQSAREMQADIEAFVRDAKLPVSSIALAEFMKGLFEEKLAAQKEALMQGRQLADIISQEIVHAEQTMTGVDSGRLSSHNLSTASGAIGVGSVPPPARSGAKWAFAAVALAAAAAAGTVIALRSKDQPAAAQTATAEPAPSKATLVIESEPSGAHIWINGEVRAEVTPATIDSLPVGKVDVKVGMEGYASKVEKVELEAGPPTKRRFTLQKGVVKLAIGGAPAGATATLDGKPVTLPNVEATPGDHHALVVSAPGHVSKTLKVTGELGETKKLDATLDKITAGGAVGAKTAAKDTAPQPGGSGKLMVSASGGWCNVSVDGKPHGATPTGTIDLSAGSHSVSCTDANGKTVSQGAKVSAGETTRVKFSL